MNSAEVVINLNEDRQPAPDEAALLKRRDLDARILNLKTLAAGAIDPQTGNIDVQRCPAALIAAGIADQATLHAALNDIILNGSKDPGCSALATFFEDLCLITDARRVLARNGLPPCPVTAGSLSWNSGGKSFAAYAWTAREQEGGCYVRELVKPAKGAKPVTGAFLSAVYRSQDSGEDESEKEPLRNTSIEARLPSGAGGMLKTQFSLPGKALLATEFSRAKEGHIAWVLRDDAFISAVRFIQADKLLPEETLAGAAQSGKLELKLFEAGKQSLAVSLLSASHQAAGKILLAQLPDRTKLVNSQKDYLTLLREVADRHISHAYAQRVAQFVLRAMDGGACQSIRRSNFDTVRLDLLEEIGKVQKQLENGSWKKLDEELRMTKALLERALGMLPDFKGNLHVPVFGCAGFSDAASVDFGEDRTTMHYSYAMMIGGPTPSPRQAVYQGPNPFKGYYILPGDKERTQVLVEPAFQEALVAFVRENNYERTKGLEASIRSHFVTAVDPKAVRLLPASESAAGAA